MFFFRRFRCNENPLQIQYNNIVADFCYIFPITFICYANEIQNNNLRNHSGDRFLIQLAGAIQPNSKFSHVMQMSNAADKYAD